MQPWYRLMGRLILATLFAISLSGGVGCSQDQKSDKPGGPNTSASGEKAKQPGGGGKKGSDQKKGGKGGKKAGGKGGKGGGAKGGKGANPNAQGRGAVSEEGTPGTADAGQTPDDGSMAAKGQGGAANGGKGKGQRGAGGKGAKGAGAEPVVLPPLEGIEFAPVPADWKAHSGGKAQGTLRAGYKLPRAGGATIDTTIFVYHLPAIKDKEREQLTQWFSKLTPQAGAAPNASVPQFVEETSPSNVKLIIADMSGQMKPAGAAEKASGDTVYRMIAAVIDSPQGPHSVKVLGPKTSVDAAYNSIITYIRSVKAKS